MEKIELFERLVDNSKTIEFVDVDVLRISNYESKEKIYLNLTGLVEVMLEKLDNEDVDKILLKDYE